MKTYCEGTQCSKRDKCALQLMAATARCYLESLGIQVTTEYGYYRDIYCILKDFGEWLSKNNIYTLPADYFIRVAKVEEL